MAAFLLLQEENKEFNGDVFNNHKEAEIYRDLEFRAVIVIQSWYRGLRTRHYLRNLNQCAVVVQRMWRGYLGRQYARTKLDLAVKKMMLDFYNQNAIKIQKIWRGFYVRKYKHNFYARKRYLELVQQKNAVVREQLEEYSQQKKQEMARHMNEMRAKKVQQDAKRNHFLMSTEQIPGIFNSPYRIYPHEMEFHMRAARFDDEMGNKSPKDLNRRKSKVKSSSNNGSNEATAAASGGKSNHNSSGSRDTEKVLPPISKLQGPFRHPKEVAEQKAKALRPTLRVQTDFYSLEEAQKELKLEEWRSRVVDETFQPFTQFRYPYKKLLHSTSDYGHLSDDYLREEQPTKRVTLSDFKRVNSPVPLFDRFGHTYTKGAGAIC